MATINNITGQPIKSRANSEAYSDNYDAIFAKKKEEAVLEPCKCGSTNLSIECTGTSHYTMDYVLCLDCRVEGNGEFGVKDAIAAWNKKTDYGET